MFLRIESFRSRKRTAPLKRWFPFVQGNGRVTFRSRKRTAPLKPVDPCQNTQQLSPFRSRKRTAPLKPAFCQKAIRPAALSVLARERPH